MLLLLPLSVDNVDVCLKSDNNGNSLILVVLLANLLEIELLSSWSALPVSKDLADDNNKFFNFIGLELALHGALFCKLELDCDCNNAISLCKLFEYWLTTGAAAT